MDRQLHKKFIPPCKRNIGIVDQYSWAQKDTNKYMCTNGISRPIYDCKGWINYSLPLEDYPPVNEIHPEIAMVRRQHLNYRGPSRFYYRMPYSSPYGYREGYSRMDQDEERTEGFYSRTRPGLILASDRSELGKLPSPHGDTRGCSACSGCV